MKWSVNQVAKLHQMCMEGVSNADMAEHFGVPVTEIHAKRSQLGITIPKVAAMKGNPALMVKPDFDALFAPKADCPRNRALLNYLHHPRANGDYVGAFNAGWEAAVRYMMVILMDSSANRKAPDEAATSDQRTDKNPTDSITARR